MAWAHAFAQGALATNDIVDKLRGVKTTVEINAPEIHQRAQERIKETLRAPAVNRAPIAEELSKLPQLAIDIQFNSDAAIIRPESYKTLGRIADALYHPATAGYQIRGGRPYRSPPASATPISVSASGGRARSARR